MASRTAAGVLVVDDDARFRALVRQVVEAAGLSVVGEAANGAEAVRLAAELKPDVITMDLEMPILDGVAATAELCRTGCAPIVIVSGSRSSAKLADAMQAGARWHVDKAQIATDLAPVLAAFAAGRR